MSTDKYKIIAKYIIKKKEKEKVSIMELMKLSYIAHGYCLAFHNKPLLDCEIQAWPLGPVPKEMYAEFRPKAPERDYIIKGVEENSEEENKKITEDQKQIIDLVIIP